MDQTAKRDECGEYRYLVQRPQKCSCCARNPCIKARAADGKIDRRNATAAGEIRISKTAMRRPRNDKRRSD